MQHIMIDDVMYVLNMKDRFRELVSKSIERTFCKVAMHTIYAARRPIVSLLLAKTFISALAMI